jgi:preprotein translocase subunit SecG
MEIYFSIAQIVISVALVVAILLQMKKSGLGGLFGGSGGGTVYTTRRGVERTLFNITIGLAIAFFVITILNVIIVS